MEIPTTSVIFSSYRPAAVLKVTGEDAFSFLQGQFTQDLRPCVEEGEVAYGLWLNHKGKVQADSFLLLRGSEWWCVSLFSPAEDLRKHLEGFIIADDVTVENVTNDWAGICVLGASGPQAEAWAKACGGFVFEAGRRTGATSFEWLYRISGDNAVDFLRAHGAAEIGAGDLERLRIEAAIPAVPRDIGQGDLPNEGALERDAISYTKGCYLGQEVMARLKSMGQVRRRLVRVAGTGVVPVDLPAEIFADGKKCGELRSVVGTGEGFVGMAMISLPGVTGRRLLSFSPEGAANIVVSI
ncbi:MAG: folate-binding protein [Nibricoccus sp.]